MSVSRWQRLATRVGLGVTIIVAALMALAVPATAHPLGNFTVNRYARVEVSAGRLRVYYVLDEAEIPAFQERAAVNADPTAFATGRAESIRRGLTVTLDGAPLTLAVATTELTQPEGQAGLPTLRLAVRYEAAVPDGAAMHEVSVADGNEPDRIGWREIVVVARGGATISSSTAPATDQSDELRHYPANLVQSPLDLRSAHFRFVGGTEPVAPLPLHPTTKAPARAGGSFAHLVTRHHLTPAVLAGMLGLAMLFGAAHALAPGHGKTIMAAYVVGGQGRTVDAALVGLVVAVMHTASVLVLGVVLFQVSRTTSIDRAYPWLTFAAGVVVVGYGAALLRSRIASRRRARQARLAHAAQVHTHAPVIAARTEVPARRATVLVGAGGPSVIDDDDVDVDHEHSHSHHHDDHAYEHGHGLGQHTHELPPDVSPLSRRGLFLLAGAGGLFPSPSALLVLVAAFTLHRVALGLTLIVAFSIGLAATLSAVAVALVYGGRLVRRRSSRLRPVAWLPVASAAIVVVLGLAFVVQGLRGIT